ncbi:MAG: hypothetical protein IPK28_18980 [Devosia sp.]|nr:hypothetical protein [Devosia sp.]
MHGQARRRLVGGAAALALAVGLGGCAYDYLQRSDKVAYSSGDAVKANLEQQTIDPSKASAYSTKGLGKNGLVIPSEAAAAAETTPAP